MELGKRIADLRKMKKVTQAQLAEYLAVNPQTVSRWEAEGGTPDIMLLPKIASFFDVSLDELFGMTDMEQINNLVYKYSVLRDEKSFQEVMRSIDIALNSAEEDRLQLQAWKVHIYIQKSRGALEKAEAELDALREDVSQEHALYLPLKLQKQQFRIQMGETTSVIKKAKAEWEEEKTVDTLYCYMAALFDAQRSGELLQLWEQDKVQTFVKEIDEKTEELWQLMFESACMEQDLDFFEKYHNEFRKNASERAVFKMEWTLARIYKALDMTEEKLILKTHLQDKIRNLDLNDYIKDTYFKQIEKL